MPAPPPAVRAYLAAQPPAHRAALMKLRAQILAAAPGAIEKISYGMPAFARDGRFLLSIAGFREHCSLFAGYSGTALARESGLAGFEVNDKGTIRFSPDRSIPARLVAKIVKLRLAENAALSAARAAKGARKKTARKQKPA